MKTILKNTLFFTAAVACTIVGSFGVVSAVNFGQKKVESFYFRAIDSLGLQPKPSDVAYLKLIDMEAEKQGVPKALARAVAVTESNIDPDATSPKGAAGVMQVMAKYHLKNCGLKNSQELYNARKNIECGVLILKQNLEAAGNAADALCMYNSGRRCSASSPRETQEYMVKILKNYPL